MPLTLNGSGGITYPDGSTNTTRSVSTAGDTMTGPLVVPAGATAAQAPRLDDVWAKGGAAGISGLYTTTVSDASGSNAGLAGTYGTPNNIPRDKFGWQIVAQVSLDNQAGGTRYIHLKTNYASTGAMMYFHMEGYAYNNGNVDTKMGLYMYTGSSILNTVVSNNGNGSNNWYSCYKAGDGKLVLIFDVGPVQYTSAQARLWVCGHSDDFINLRLESQIRSNSVSALY
jgi:hypothetical protein